MSELLLVPTPESFSLSRSVPALRGRIVWLQHGGRQHGTASQTAAPLWCVIFFILMCYFFLWERKASWVGPFSAFATTSSSSFNPAGIWLSAYTDQRLGELTKQELLWCVRSVYKSVVVPANHLQSEWRAEREQSQRAALYAELHVTPLCMGNMELANM